MSAYVRKLGAVGGHFSRYLRETTASTSTIFGLCALPVFLGVGVAVDMARANMEQSNFHAALDAAALAVAADDRSSTLGLTASQIAAREIELKALAQQYIDQNHAFNDFSIQVTNLQVKITGAEVTLSAEGEFPTTIMGLFGIHSIDLDFQSKIKKAQRPIELVMVMDTTGSMASGGKMTGAKNAAKTLLNRLYGGSPTAVPQSEFLRVALVPFSGAVRLNPSAYDFNINWIDTTGANPLSKINLNAVSGVPSVWNNYYAWSRIKRNTTTYHSWNGCVEARKNGSSSSGQDYNVNDTAPNAGIPDTLFPAYFNPDTPNGSWSASYGINYITGTSTSTSAVGSECAGLSSSVCSSTSVSALYQKQENWRKYDNTVVGAESTSTNGPWTNCTGSAIVPMTYKRSTVEAGIDAMVPTGPTVIPEGLAWGWRVISPTQPFTLVEGTSTLPASTISHYGDVRWQKVMVLMTDGDNDPSAGGYSLNGTTYTAYGFQGEALATNRFNTNTTSQVVPALDTAMNTLCTRIKASGIKLYVAAFGTGISSATKTRLRNCATGPEYYAEATTSAALEAFFDHIGQDVLNKSIYVSN